MKHLLKFAAVSLCWSLLMGCSSVAADHDSDMYYTASALTKLSGAVDGTIRYGEPSPQMSESELLEASVAGDPSLITPFQDFIVRVRRDGQDSSVLVCDADGTVALLEDVGCTSKLDVHHWRTSPARPCSFTLNPRSMCMQ